MSRRAWLCHNAEGVWHDCIPVWCPSNVDDHRGWYAKQTEDRQCSLLRICWYIVSIEFCSISSSNFHSFFWTFSNRNYLATCTLSVITTILTAYQYGLSTAANVLEMLPNSNWLYATILLVTVQLCLSHAVGSSALFQNIEEYLRIPRGLYN